MHLAAFDAVAHAMHLAAAAFDAVALFVDEVLLLSLAFDASYVLLDDRRCTCTSSLSPMP